MNSYLKGCWESHLEQPIFHGLQNRHALWPVFARQLKRNIIIIKRIKFPLAFRFLIIIGWTDGKKIHIKSAILWLSLNSLSFYRLQGDTAIFFQYRVIYKKCILIIIFKKQTKINYEIIYIFTFDGWCSGGSIYLLSLSSSPVVEKKPFLSESTYKTWDKH